jgi:hypothetical protein
MFQSKLIEAWSKTLFPSLSVTENVDPRNFASSPRLFSIKPLTAKSPCLTMPIEKGSPTSM